MIAHCAPRTRFVRVGALGGGVLECVDYSQCLHALKNYRERSHWILQSESSAPTCRKTVDSSRPVRQTCETHKSLVTSSPVQRNTRVHAARTEPVLDVWSRRLEVVRSEVLFALGTRDMCPSVRDHRKSPPRRRALKTRGYRARSGPSFDVLSACTLRLDAKRSQRESLQLYLARANTLRNFDHRVQFFEQLYARRRCE